MKALALALVCACSYSPARLAGDDDVVIDAPGVTDGSPDAPPPVLGPWSAPVQLPGINSAFIDDDPSMTDDLLELYFGSNRDTLDEEIFVAKRTSVNDPFGMPQRVSELNSIFAETTPRVSRDGLTIVFASTRDFTHLELYIATRAARNDPWGEPQRITELGSSQDDFAPFVSDDRRTMIFASDRVGAADILTSKRANAQAAWETAVVSEVSSTTAFDVDPIAIDADTIYFASDRGGNMDIYIATRSGTTFTIAPVTEWNSNSIERDIWVSGDQRTAVFSSTRAGGDDDIFISTRSVQ